MCIASGAMYDGGGAAQWGLTNDSKWGGGHGLSKHLFSVSPRDQKMPSLKNRLMLLSKDCTGTRDVFFFYQKKAHLQFFC